MKVTVAVALADRQEVFELELAEGATVRQALERARIAERFPGIELEGMRLGIWSRPCERDMVLRDGDRVELYRPLIADPKSQRRSRARLKPSTRSRNEP
jgi:uncharacterized protein